MQQKTAKKPRGRKPKPPRDGEQIAEESTESYNLTDPDSRVMRKSKLSAFTQSINAQASVDVESYLLVGQHISQSSSDSNELLKGFQAIPETIGKPSAYIADAGYVNTEAIKTMNTQTDCELYVSVHSENAHKERSYDYRPDETKKSKSMKNPTLLAMRDKLRTPEGKAIYRLRSQTIETVFGTIKEAIGFRRFLLRGLEKMSGEWELMCLAYNCKRLHKLQTG